MGSVKTLALVLVACGTPTEHTPTLSALSAVLIPASVEADRDTARPGDRVTFTVVFADADLPASVRASICPNRDDDGRDLSCFGQPDERIVASGPAVISRGALIFDFTYDVPTDALVNGAFQEGLLLWLEQGGRVSLTLATVRVTLAPPEAALLSSGLLTITQTVAIDQNDRRTRLADDVALSAGRYRILAETNELTTTLVFCAGSCVATEETAHNLALSVGTAEIFVIARSGAGKAALARYRVTVD